MFARKGKAKERCPICKEQAMLVTCFCTLRLCKSCYLNDPKHADCMEQHVDKHIEKVRNAPKKSSKEEKPKRYKAKSSLFEFVNRISMEPINGNFPNGNFPGYYS